MFTWVRGWTLAEWGSAPIPRPSWLGNAQRGGRGSQWGESAGCTTLKKVGRIRPTFNNSSQQPAMQTPMEPPECVQAWKRPGSGRISACAFTFSYERRILTIIEDLVLTLDWTVLE